MPISIKAARVNAGLTQEEVAKALKKSKNTIVSYEAYTSSPDMNVGLAMAKLFNMSVDDIIWEKE
jgi:DNA-binding XRE family transcriptional regulator